MIAQTRGVLGLTCVSNIKEAASSNAGRCQVSFVTLGCLSKSAATGEHYLLLHIAHQRLCGLQYS
jgi:hypothetical protein